MARPLIIRPVIRPTSKSERARGAGLVFFGFRGSMTLEKARELIGKLFSRFHK